MIKLISINFKLICTYGNLRGQLAVLQIHAVDVLGNQQYFGIEHDEGTGPHHGLALIGDHPEDIGPQKQHKCQPTVVDNGPGLDWESDECNLYIMLRKTSRTTYHHQNVGEYVTVLVDEATHADKSVRYLIQNGGGGVLLLGSLLHGVHLDVIAPLRRAGGH